MLRTMYTQCNHLWDERARRCRGILQVKAHDREEARIRLAILADISGMKALRKRDSGESYYVTPKPEDMYVQESRY